MIRRTTLALDEYPHTPDPSVAGTAAPVLGQMLILVSTRGPLSGRHPYEGGWRPAPRGSPSAPGAALTLF